MRSPEDSPSPSETRRIILLQELAQSPRKLKRAVAGLPESAFHFRPYPEEWSCHMVLAHLANLEPLFLARFKRMLHESEPTLSSLGPGQASPHSEAQPEELLAAYQAGRDDILLLLYAIKAEDWRRRAEHMTLGPTDLRHQVEVLIRHDQEHLGQLVDLRRAWERHSASVEMRPNEEADNAK